MIRTKQAFTLLELSLSMILIAILWVIWFNVYKSYIIIVRDSSRIVELENIETSLNSYVLKYWFYPDPSLWVNITYSGGLVWTQWIFDNNLSIIIWYSNNILDPLTKSEYTYSLKNSKREFSIAWVLENNVNFLSNNPFISNVYAEWIWTKIGYSIVKWNYNGELLSVKANATNYVLALPSIVSTDLSSNELINILGNNKLVYNHYQNLPASYTWTVYNLDANLDFSAKNLIVYSWSINDLKTESNRIDLLKNSYNSYSWSILWKKITINRIDKDDLFSIEPGVEIKYFACDLINNKIKYLIECD
jgi:type II secretory pathway pseudopilin PulG